MMELWSSVGSAETLILEPSRPSHSIKQLLMLVSSDRDAQAECWYIMKM